MQQLAVESEKLSIMPTQAVIDYFINNQESKGTQRTYGSALRGFFTWTKGQDFRTVTPFQALEYSQYLKSTCAVATTQTRIATLKMFFGFAKDTGLMEINPFALVKQKASPNRVSEKFLNVKEVDRLLIALKQKGEKQFIAGILLASTGMRISELQQISWKDFVRMPDGSVSVNLLRKGGEYQLLPLREDVWEAVQGFMGREIDQADESPLLLNPSYHRVSNVSIRTWIIEAGKQAKIKRHTNPHLLRHSFATNSLDSGADLRDVSWYLNHSSLVITSLYAHPTNKKVGEFIKLNI